MKKFIAILLLTGLVIQLAGASVMSDFFNAAESKIQTFKNRIINKFNTRCTSATTRNCVNCNFKFCADSLIPNM